MGKQGQVQFLRKSKARGMFQGVQSVQGDVDVWRAGAANEPDGYAQFRQHGADEHDLFSGWSPAEADGCAGV